MKNLHAHQAGFTVVEVMVTLIVASIFIIATSMLYGAISSATASSRNLSDASDIAYSYLRKYVYNGADPSAWNPPFVCDSTPGPTNTDDYTYNQNAAGQVLESGSISSANTHLPQPVTYSVNALATFGCNNSNVGTPIKVISTVTYGPDSLKMVHSSLVGYE